VAARTWIKRYGGALHVARFVSIAVPHHGTALHRLLAPSLRGVLDPHGAVVRAANEGPEPVPTTVIRARHDLQVVPPESAALPGVPERVFDDLGHNALLTSPDAHAAVLAALRLR
jgi:pimeloyl-ACP methyl ester carboxylesterase